MGNGRRWSREVIPVWAGENLARCWWGWSNPEPHHQQRPCRVTASCRGAATLLAGCSARSRGSQW